MEQKHAAQILHALGHNARLELFRLLVQAGDGGLNIGQIGKHLSMPPSTLAHHITTLVKANVITQHQNGRETINIANFKLVESMASYLFNDCCQGVEA
ncbi:MAG: helix-turn-helix transcriptional regulator [OCS116 cluster bacterium]|uniref:Transcriptional regulator n=1 Tax=OCS116 cluster bacterium TaxID=2030921 RepID=A0A2A4YRK3_9PROT|nr:helix-turn-helix transcriptional regulator [OCS116 cluster bacterium]